MTVFSPPAVIDWNDVRKHKYGHLSESASQYQGKKKTPLFSVEKFNLTSLLIKPLF